MHFCPKILCTLLHCPPLVLKENKNFLNQWNSKKKEYMENIRFYFFGKKVNLKLKVLSDLMSGVILLRNSSVVFFVPLSLIKECWFSFSVQLYSTIFSSNLLEKTTSQSVLHSFFSSFYSSWRESLFANIINGLNSSNFITCTCFHGWCTGQTRLSAFTRRWFILLGFIASHFFVRWSVRRVKVEGCLAYMSVTFWKGVFFFSQ